MNNYFRITAYNPENNIGFIALRLSLVANRFSPPRIFVS